MEDIATSYHQITGDVACTLKHEEGLQCLTVLQVLRLLDLPQGTIPPGQAAGLNFVFHPVEAKEYTVSLPIKLGNGAKEILTVTGKGFHPMSAAVQLPLTETSPAISSAAGSAGNDSKAMLRTLWQTQVDKHADKATWPGFSPASSQETQQRQLLVLSHGVVSFGPVSVKRCSKRVVALIAGAQHEVEFEWDLGTLGANGCLDGQLDIQPASGKLAPGECCLCKLTFQAGLNPQLFKGALQCKALSIPNSAASRSSALLHSSQAASMQPHTFPSASKGDEVHSSNPAQSMPSTASASRASPRLLSSPGAASGAGTKSAGKAAPNSPAQTSSAGRAAPPKQASSGQRTLSRASSLSSPTKSKAPTSPLSPVASQRRASLSSQNRASISQTSPAKSPQGQKPTGPALQQNSPSQGTRRSTTSGMASQAGAKSKQSPARISSITNLPARSTSQSPGKAKQQPGALQHHSHLLQCQPELPCFQACKMDVLYAH